MEELVALAKAEDKIKQSKLDKAPLKRNQEPSVKKKTISTNAKPTPSFQLAGDGPTNRPHMKYSFKDDLVESLFTTLNQAKKLKLPEPKNKEDIGIIDNPLILFISQ